MVAKREDADGTKIGGRPGMESDDIRKLKDLQSENQALKQIVADQALLIEASKKLLRKNGLRPPTEGRGPAS